MGFNMKRLLISITKRLAITCAVMGIFLYTGEMRPAYLGAAVAKNLSQRFQKGMCYATWESDRYLSPYSDKALEALAETGANCVSVVVTWYQKNAQAPHISPNGNTPTDKSLVHVIQKARQLGLSVMLKPHVDLIETADGQWRGDIFFYKEEEWAIWFGDYKKFILRYAKLAEKNGVDMLCIGTELSGTIEQKERWKDIIRAVRGVYGGQITYAANWDNEFDKVEFWDELDYAGVDAYFPMSKDDKPDFAELKNACDNWVDKIESWAKPLGKPILFTEVGYSSTPSASLKPWEEKTPGGADTKIQANCYKAVLETVWGKQWLAGIYWWKWNTNPDAGGANNKGFTPQNKPAQEILAEWYRK